MAGAEPPAQVPENPGWKAVALAAVVAGVGVRIADWWSAPPLWIDEAFLAVSFTERSWRSLLVAPLAYHQIAPPGYVLLEAVLAGITGGGERTLRLVALGAGSAALALFPFLARRIVSAPAAALATALFATSMPLVLLSNQVKPYALDLLAGVLLPLLALRWMESPSRIRALAVAWTCCVLSLLSFGTAFATAGIAVAFVLDRRRLGALPGAPVLAKALLLSLLVTGCVAASVVGRESAAVNLYYRNFWGFAFPSLRGGVGEVLLFPLRWAEALVRYLLTMAGAKSTIVAAGVLATGAVALRSRSFGARCAGWTAGAALAASAARLYPAQDRTGTVLAAPLLIGLAFLVELLARGARQSFRAASPSLADSLVVLGAAALLVAPSNLRFEVTRPREDPRAVVSQLALRRHRAETVYVFYSARPAWTYYARQSGLELSGGELVLGGCHRRELRPYLEEIDRLRSSGRAWFVFSHTAHTAAAAQERRVIEQYLRAIGEIELQLVPPAERDAAPDDAALLVAFRPDGSPDAPRAADFVLPTPIAKGSCVLFADEGAFEAPGGP